MKKHYISSQFLLILSIGHSCVVTVCASYPESQLVELQWQHKNSMKVPPLLSAKFQCFPLCIKFGAHCQEAQLQTKTRKTFHKATKTYIINIVLKSHFPKNQTLLLQQIFIKILSLFHHRMFQSYLIST